jgi:predicted enzyme related to lactoylglutathione lyase
MANPFVHAELNSTDPKKSKEFYGKLFDWKYEDIPGADGITYTSIEVGENKYGVGGGLLEQRMPGAPSAWMPYVLVDDVEASTKKARSLGATVLKGVTEVPNMGALSILKDPTGAVIGLWQTKM